jgi:hypothetical protein
MFWYFGLIEFVQVRKAANKNTSQFEQRPAAAPRRATPCMRAGLREALVESENILFLPKCASCPCLIIRPWPCLQVAQYAVADRCDSTLNQARQGCRGCDSWGATGGAGGRLAVNASLALATHCHYTSRPHSTCFVRPGFKSSGAQRPGSVATPCASTRPGP